MIEQQWLGIWLCPKLLQTPTIGGFEHHFLHQHFKGIPPISDKPKYHDVV
jgi:hypothetical protein